LGLGNRLLKNKTNWIRISGLFGVLGSITLFSGDMLFYYGANHTSLTENMGNASDTRIIASGITALLAAWFYILGLGQIHHAFKPSKALYRNTITICFGAIFIAYGVIHGAFVAIATSAKLAIENHLDLTTSISLARDTNNMLRLLVYPIFGVLSIVFFLQVWKKKSLYPRWILLFFPLIPFLMQEEICANLSGKISIIICGGYLNLILLIFFLASTIALWNSVKTKAKYP
jgi:hypothetical protein